ncbi:MAG: biopolymer transporter ExbD [Bernardetiaceae bacterium]|jgi:biopolymer transport protein ExbD|nr:biopolymer transporter ExbD [Bernardetiaceae bacterium]
MAKFAKKPKALPAISTASLPDIVFMLLFFFMVTTVLRETDLLIMNRLPAATQLQKLEKKSLVSYIYVGKPRDTGKYGTEPRIQLNDVLALPRDIVNFVFNEKADRAEGERDMLTMSLKVDREAKMGIVSDVKQQLREANALKVNYSTTGR